VKLLSNLALATLSFLVFAGSANALAQNATSHKYFDETGGLGGKDARIRIRTA
jgi:hypothetical protein